MWYFGVFWDSYNVSQLRKQQFGKILYHSSYKISIKLENYELDRLYINTWDTYDTNSRGPTTTNSIKFLFDTTVTAHPSPSLLTTMPHNATFFDLLDFFQILLMVQQASGRNQWF